MLKGHTISLITKGGRGGPDGGGGCIRFLMEKTVLARNQRSKVTSAVLAVGGESELAYGQLEVNVRSTKNSKPGDKNFMLRGGGGKTNLSRL